MIPKCFLGLKKLQNWKATQSENMYRVSQNTVDFFYENVLNSVPQ